MCPAGRSSGCPSPGLWRGSRKCTCLTTAFPRWTIKRTLRHALADNAGDAAVIIVGQRIATVMHADHIIVLKDGVIDGMGTHKELLKSCGTYQEIAMSQLSEKELGMEVQA